MENKLAIRQAKQNCFCRLCDKEIERNTEDIVSWYSWRNRGQNIHICIPCMKLLGDLVENHQNNTTIVRYWDKASEDGDYSCKATIDANGLWSFSSLDDVNKPRVAVINSDGLLATKVDERR